MLEAVLALLLGVHLLLVNVAMIGPLICVWLDWRRSRFGDDVAGRAGHTLARWANWSLTGGVLLGGLLLAARWWQSDDRYFAAVGAVPRSRLWFAGLELLFYFACMGAYVGLWNRWRRWRIGHRLLAVAASTNLLMHFPALFAIIAILSSRPEAAVEPLGAAGYRRMLIDPEVLSHVIHVWVAALAVSGATLMGLGLRMARREQDPAAVGRLVQRGAVVALGATLAQIPLGFWLTTELPASQRQPLLGGDLLATGLFVASLLTALSLMHRLAGIALGDNGPKQIRRAIGVTCVLVLLMVGTRCRTTQRAGALQPAASRAEASVDVPAGRSTELRLRSTAIAVQ